MGCPYCGCTMTGRLFLMGVNPNYRREWGHVCENGACEAYTACWLPGRSLAEYRRDVERIQRLRARLFRPFEGLACRPPVGSKGD